MRLLRLSSMGCLFAIIQILVGCGSSTIVTQPAAAPAISTQPASQTVLAGQTATFSVAATSSSALSYQWQKGNAPIMGATSATFITLPTTASDSGSQFSVVVSNSGGKTTSNVALLTVNPTTDVLTYHSDIARTGQNLTETILTTTNVNSAQFGKLGFYPVVGHVDAQPLYASNVATPNNGTHNLS